VKKIIIIILALLFLAPRTDACVGRVLHIGVTNSLEGQVFAEMLSSLIVERTGSTVAIQLYRDEQELYEAVNRKQVDISIESTDRAMQVLHRSAVSDLDRAYEVVKESYEKEKGLVWLKPFGFVHRTGMPGTSYTAAVLRVETLNNFPALPRVIGKLGSTLNDESYAHLMRTVESGEKPKKAARDFLKSKKLI